MSDLRKVSVNHGSRAIKRVLHREVDIAVVILSALPESTLSLFIDGTLTALPVWLFAVVPVHSLRLPDGYELKMDLDTLARIW